MARRLTLKAGGDRVTARLVVPRPAAAVGIVLAHGAGAGQDHRWMVAMRDALTATGHAVMTFNYAYTEAGRSAPDRAPRLAAVHKAALRRMAGYTERIVAAGKSMGGRIGSHVVADLAADDPLRSSIAGLVYYGYPLVPLGKGEPRDTSHLHHAGVPQLFFAGTRDRLSRPDLIAPLAATLPDATVVVLDGADHGFHVPRSAGLSDDDVIMKVAADTANWLAHLVLGT